MTAAEFQATMDEADFQAWLVEHAEKRGWTVHLTGDSRRSRAGWPDVVCGRMNPDGTSRIIIAELKATTGRLSRMQRLWITLLRGAGIEAFVWTALDRDAIERELA